MKKVAVVIGARPQFIKLSPFIEALSGKADLVLIHTGQHYDFEMSEIFFRQLNLPEVDYHLGVGSDNQASQVGKIMIGLEKALLENSPDMVVVIGDTNSTLAGALTAAKNTIPLAHIEAGLRSKNKRLPEQINRVVTDRLADVLCCPTQSSIENLKAEGINKNVFLTGDILYDLIDKINPPEEFTENCLNRNGLKPDEFILMTVHRAENVDNFDFLQSLVNGLKEISPKIFLPLHPRTEKRLKEFDLFGKLMANSRVQISKPVGIVESLALTKSSLGVLTDSGGLQREAAYFGKKAYVLRDETEWLELEQCGAVECIKCNLHKVKFDWDSFVSPGAEYFQPAAQKIADCILKSSF